MCIVKSQRGIFNEYRTNVISDRITNRNQIQIFGLFSIFRCSYTYQIQRWIFFSYSFKFFHIFIVIKYFDVPISYFEIQNSQRAIRKTY